MNLYHFEWKLKKGKGKLESILPLKEFPQRMHSTRARAKHVWLTHPKAPFHEAPPPRGTMRACCASRPRSTCRTLRPPDPEARTTCLEARACLGVVGQRGAPSAPRHAPCVHRSPSPPLTTRHEPCVPQGPTPPGPPRHASYVPRWPPPPLGPRHEDA